MMVVTHTIVDGRSSADRPRTLLTAPIVDDVNVSPYDVTADGERFLVLLRADESSTRTTRLVMILDWFEELKQLVPMED